VWPSLEHPSWRAAETRNESKDVVGNGLSEQGGIHAPKLTANLALNGWATRGSQIMGDRPAARLA